jgi:hypothetical protein
MRLAALALLAVCSGLAPASAVPDSRLATPSTAVPALTGKERLSDKASDEQRLNDCKVPPERRTRARPTECQAGPQ